MHLISPSEFPVKCGGVLSGVISRALADGVFLPSVQENHSSVTGRESYDSRIPGQPLPKCSERLIMQMSV